MDTIRKNQTKTKNESLCINNRVYYNVYLSDIFLMLHSNNENKKEDRKICLSTICVYTFVVVFFFLSFSIDPVYRNL